MMQFIETNMPDVYKLLDDIVKASWETVYMLLLTIIFAGILGLIVGVIVTVTRPGGILENKVIYKILDAFINIFRSIPFIILLALLINVTRFIVGTTIGSTAASVPIIIATIPFFARQVEIALLEVDSGVIEAAQSMGCSPWDIIVRVYLREGLPSLLRVSASTVINVISLTAMAGAVAGGGLGTIAIARGYNRSKMDVILVATFLILVIVFVTQLIFNWIIKKIEH
ncbi:MULTISPECIES: methionine ABC transporter permease [Globicatella]|uniref:methionine ABC transporter permease n=1 Tax=Globicatella TaxID=13075 RepID=UPI000825CCC4|nr:MULTISPECIES: methionine ABC transporter permease [Globicatella]MDK7630941.1 methionine ABC transporter permease [Globicatella sanguinis]OFK62225.1 methionine ABC transporter permease [Globicatella sp. HMSC072A10]WIK65601.1 methionine ABC transporter permease [Globicatella sanguinis]WKT55006.1 methionine ABC transporter permease [Globicatella sanguinis]